MTFPNTIQVSGQGLGVVAGTDLPKDVEIPDRFFQVQDSSGFFWQTFGNGALVSGDTQYLQSGLNLLVDGEPFAPTKVLSHEPGSGSEKIDLQLTELRSAYSISRDLWFDTQRSGVRVLDTLTNTSKAELNLTITLRTTYPFAWQSLHGSDGALLGNDPALQLGAADFSLGVHFSPSDGRHDTVFIVGSEKGGLKPELKASSNSRELTFLYTIKIPPGESRSLLHWILQRNLPEISAENSFLSPFYQREKLILPGVDAKSFPQVVNFAASSFEAEPTTGSQLKNLVALNALTDRIAFHRRSGDFRWISPANQISGTLNRDMAITIGTTYGGDQVVKVSEIAALRGGAGIGRVPLTYLRDGRVIAGPIRKGELQWSAGGGASAIVPAPEILDPAEVNLLLFATETSDGVAPPQTTHFLQLINGSVLALVMAAEMPIEWLTPWGAVKWKWSDLIEASHTSTPSPRLRIHHKNGTEISAFPSSDTQTLTTAFGEKIEVPSLAVDHIWIAGIATTRPQTQADLWLDFSEVPPGRGPGTGFLLTGNQMLEGNFKESSLTLTDKGSKLHLETSRIVSLRRSPEPGADHLIEVVLDNGDRIVGEITSPYLKVSRAGGELEIPAAFLLSYRRAAP